MAIAATEPSTALIQNDIVLFGLIAATLGVVFWTSSRETGFFKKFYTYVPALLLCYFIPGIYNSIGLIDGGASKLYNPVASRVLLPASAAMPPQVSPATVSGWITPISQNATHAPSITLIDAPAYIASSFGPSFSTPFRSMVSVSSTRAAGNSTRLATGL